jgi:hypothetical protein
MGIATAFLAVGSAKRGDMKIDHWICQACKNRASTEASLRSTMPTQLGPIGSYPIDASPDVEPRTATDAYRIETDPSVATLKEITHAQVEGARWLLSRPLNIDFGVFH